MGRVWGVLQADTNAARLAVKAAGCTHVVVSAAWDELQPSTTGTIDSTVMARVKAAMAHCVLIGLVPILSVDIHYPPSWVLSGVEKFKDQAGNDYVSADVASGKAVRNWVWTATGRTYVSDLITRFSAALTAAERAAVGGVRMGGGWYGELHYPEPISGGPTYAWYGFGASMQAGTDLASGMSVCPVPGYIPYTGTDAQDCAFLNWYLNGLVTWGVWLVNQFKAAGFGCKLYVLLPGYGVRLNQARSDAGYKQAASMGEDHTRIIAALMHEPQFWPYVTWLNTTDGFPGGSADSDKAQWKSIYEKALLRGKHYRMIGENTGGEDNAGMNGIFAGALGSAAYAGYPGLPLAEYYYEGMVWLSYSDLQAGGGKATMANYASQIALT